MRQPNRSDFENMSNTMWIQVTPMCNISATLFVKEMQRSCYLGCGVSYELVDDTNKMGLKWSPNMKHEITWYSIFWESGIFSKKYCPFGHLKVMLGW